MKILDRLPLLLKTRAISFGQDRATFHRNAVIVWFSVASRGEFDPRRISSPFPALLDTGNHGEAYLHEHHLRHWAGMTTARLPFVQMKRVNGQDIPFHEGAIWIHPNTPGTHERSPEGRPYRLGLVDGLAVGPPRQDKSIFPRVPLVGLSALHRNRLDFWFDSKTGHFYLRTADWRSRLIRGLCRFF